jgi:hypothetical protein
MAVSAWFSRHPIVCNEARMGGYYRRRVAIIASEGRTSVSVFVACAPASAVRFGLTGFWKLDMIRFTQSARYWSAQCDEEHP